MCALWSIHATIKDYLITSEVLGSNPPYDNIRNSLMGYSDKIIAVERNSKTLPTYLNLFYCIEGQMTSDITYR